MKATHAAALLTMLIAGTPVLAQQQTPTGATPVPAAQPTAKKEKPKLYDESADAKQQIADALAKAKKNNRRVLVQWGGNWCGWCIMLGDLYKKDTDIAKELLYEYDVVHVDAGKNNKNMDLGTSYGADLAKHGFPFLTILDADGKVLVNQETSSLENKDQNANPGHDAKMVLALLKKHQAPALNGQSILDAGLAAAKKEGKVVFLHFGAPWCGWCHKLEDWMALPEVKAILSKQFIDVKIDTDRDTSGAELLKTYAKSDKTGIPWFVFLDGDNKPLADSTGEKGNVGFPAADDEITHFQAMLKKAATKLSDTDINTLVQSLRTERDKSKATTH